MNNKHIIILTDIDNFFGQTRKPWVSIDTQLFIDTFKKQGLDVTTYTFDELLNSDISIEDSIIIYTFSQKHFTRQYVLDLLYHLSEKNTIIPSYDLLKCHENKGYQELLKKKLNIKSLRSYYFSNPNSIKNYDIEFPIVLKSISGSNGKQVYLVNNKDELLTLLNKYFIKLKTSDKLDLTRRKYFRKKKSYKEYPEYSNKTDLEQYTEYVKIYKPFVLQEYIPDLQFDYRVLVMYDKYFVTKRHVKANDFRASGAKKFDFDFTPDDKLMTFAKDIFDKFKQPMLSIDICEKDGEYFLIEYQALHFGINVLVKSKGYYFNNGNDWEFNKRKDKFEIELANSFIKYLKRK